MKNKLASLAIIVIIIGTAAFPFFARIRVICKTQYGDCPPEVGSALSSLNSKSLFKSQRGLDKILKGNPIIADFSSQFKLPDMLYVNLVIKKPDFALFDKTSGKTYLLDKGGGVLGEDGETSLPTVIQSGANPNITASVFVRGVYEMYGVQKGEITDSGLVIELPGSIRVIFPLDAPDPRVLLGSLRLVYSKITSGDMVGKYSEIDLRFKNPVLR